MKLDKIYLNIDPKAPPIAIKIKFMNLNLKTTQYQTIYLHLFIFFEITNIIILILE